MIRHVQKKVNVRIVLSRGYWKSKCVSEDMSKRPVAIVAGPKNADFKNPLLKTLLPISIALSQNIKRKSQVDATKTFLICEKHCFEKNAYPQPSIQQLSQINKSCLYRVKPRFCNF